MKQGYVIVDPGLAQPRYGLSDEAQARVLAYLMHHLEGIAKLPEGVKFAIIPVQYLGKAYPTIGLYTETTTGREEELTQFSFALEEKIANYIGKIGVSRLLELSSGEQVNWNDTPNSLRTMSSNLA